MRVTLTDAGGNPVDSRIASIDGTVNFERLFDAPYRLKVELNEAPSFTGVITGELDLQPTVAGVTEIPVAVGGTPASVLVQPGEARITAGATVALTAAARLADGPFTFAPLEGFVWSGGNASATVSTAGVVSGLAGGSASIRATLGGTGLFGTSAVTVQGAPTATRAPLTLLVYLSAANDLFPASQTVMEELEKIGGTANFRVVVQWKQSQILFPGSTFDGTRRYLVVRRPVAGIQSTLVQDLGTGVDMGAPATLRGFLDWGRANFPSDRYGVVVWGRGNGWARSPGKGRDVGYDDEFGSALTPRGLADALGGARSSFVILDGDFMNAFEVAHAIRERSDFLVASPTRMVPGGFPYATGLADFANRPVLETSLQLRAFVDAYANAYPNEPVAASVLRLDRIGAAAEGLSGLGNNLLATRDVSEEGPWGDAQNGPSGGATYVDLIGLAERLRVNPESPEPVRSAADATVNLVRAAVAHERHVGGSPNLIGPTIDVAPLSPGDYRDLPLSAATRWDEWVTREAE